MYASVDDLRQKKSKDTWDRGSLDPSDHSKGHGVASTNFFFTNVALLYAMMGEKSQGVAKE